VSGALIEDVGRPASVGGGRRPVTSRLGLRWPDRTRLVRILMLLPVVVLFGVFFLWPLVEILLRSFDVQGRAAYGGLAPTLSHYSDLFSDSALRRVFLETFEIAAISTVLTLLLALPTAYLLTRVSGRLAAVLLLLLMMPFWVSIVVRLFALTDVLGQRGIVNGVAGSLGLGGPFPLLFNTTATVIGMVTYMLPYMILLLYAGMSGVDTSLMTAARTLGASPRRAFTSIYIPLVRGAVLSSMLLIFVLSLGFYLTPKILGGPENITAPIYIQSQINNFQWGTASATGIALLLVTLAGYVVALRFGGNRTGLGTGHSGIGKGDAGREPLRFGPASVFMWTITVLILIFLLGPLLVIARSAFDTGALLVWPPHGFTFHWFSEAFSDPKWTEPFSKSVVVATITAVLSTAAAVVMARTFLRVRSVRKRALIEAIVLTPLVVPIILLGVGLYSVESRLNMVGTDLGLVFGHAILAVPIAFVIVVAAMSRIDPSHETVAWTLGASRSRAFWTVVVPRILPSVFGAFISSFVISWDEAIIAFFITGIHQTLPVAIFSSLAQNGNPSLAAVATTLIGFVIAGLALVLLAQFAFKRVRARRR
jgi:putative spermidine/putrescine transport system permease protein